MRKLVKARIKLIKRQPFFGRLCLQLQPKESKLVPTAGIDGEYLYYNKKFIESLSDEELLGVLVHETLHASLGHLWRIGKRDRHRWNIAADYAVNLIVEQNNFVLPSNTLLNHKYSKCNAEQIYKKLPKTKTFTICMSGMDGKGKSGDKKFKGKGKCPCGKSHAMWGKGKKSKKKMKQMERRWKAALEEASHMKGSIPAGFKRIIEEMKPKEDWKAILSSYLSASLTDFDFMKRDRRTLSSPFYFPDLSDTESLENVVVAIDTSGSIGQSELSRFVSEVKKILSSFGNVKGWLIDCDADIGKVIDINEAKSKASYSGGGGTSHEPVFREIDKRQLDPKVTICFTDLYTDYPNKAPSYPVLWLVTPDSTAEKPPFGRVIKMKN